MCQDCNTPEWRDNGYRHPNEFWDALPDRRRWLLAEAHHLIEGAAVEPGHWQGGNLHVQVDDDNYDVDYTFHGPAEDVDPIADQVAGAAWNGLRYRERVLVVAWVNAYYSDVRPPARPDPTGPACLVASVDLSAYIAAALTDWHPPLTFPGSLT